MSTNKNSVLVIGAGVGGIKASLELAEAGSRVYLCDRSPTIGGSLIQMDKWFPNNHCGMCQMLPVFSRDTSSQYCLRRGLVHPNIELLPLTEVERVSGEAGNFEVTLCSRPSGVNPELCTGCGFCAKACPVETESRFDEGLNSHKAIYMPHPFISPNAYTIDWDSCTRCGACVGVCQVNAIDLKETERVRQLKVGAIIIATGFDEFDPHLTTQYGYKRFPNVITSIELERLLSPAGPTGGELLRPSDNQIPNSVAFLQCIGSRDRQRNYCSSACCMYSLKEALLIKEKYPLVDARIFFMDLRAFGKGYYRYYEQARDEAGVKFTRCRIPAVKEDRESRDVILSTVADDGTLAKEPFELVVLSVGQAPSSGFQKLCQALGVGLNKWGFCQTRPFSSVETTREGVYVCGSASAPKDINDTMIEAGAAACQALKILPQYVATILPEKTAELPSEKVELGVLLCNCGGEIDQAINLGQLTGFCRELPGVVHVEEMPYLCHRDSWEYLNRMVKEQGLNRLVIAACDPSRIIETGLDSLFVQIVNLRQGVALVHRDNPQAATEKAKKMLAMATEMARSQEPVVSSPTPVSHRALIIGGGLAGLKASLSIARPGLEVHLVEKSAELGGHLRHIYSTLEDGDTVTLLEDLKTQVKENTLIHLHIETEVIEARGYAGNFEVNLRDKDSVIQRLNAGAIVVATGAEEGVPKEYLYGKSKQVMTQSELERRLFSGELDPKRLKSVVMLQCVGSRDSERPYCSRICCSEALKNALTLKKQNPDIEIFILYRDIMSYGFKEEYYTEARNKGVIFVRYEPESKPEVRKEGERLVVEVTELVLGGKLVLEPDILALSPPVVPPDNMKLARILGVGLTEDGFYKEAEEKFHPVDFLTGGIYVCGLAHSPRGIEESITQAEAVAQRVVSLLARGNLVSGRMVSEIVQRRCSKCELCVKACPYNARVKDNERNEVVIREALCQGCGACVVACPSGAARLRGFKDEQVFSLLDAAI